MTGYLGVKLPEDILVTSTWVEVPQLSCGVTGRFLHNLDEAKKRRGSLGRQEALVHPEEPAPA